MKKRLLAFLSLSIALIMVLNLSACSKDSSKDTTAGSSAGTAEKTTETASQPDKTDSEPAQKEIKTLTVMCHASWVKQGPQAVFDMVASRPELGAKLELEKVPEGDSGEQVIQARFAAGEVPDILWWQAAAYVNTKIKAEQFIDLKGDWMNDYPADALATPSYTVDGKLIVAPFGSTDIFGMLYNKRVFAEAGVEVPKNWDELLDACEKLKAKGVIPVYYSGKDAWTLQIFPLAAAPRETKNIDPTTLAANMNVNKTKWVDLHLIEDAIAKAKELVDKGYVQKTFLSDTYVQAQNALLDGTSAMYPMNTWLAADLQKISPEKYNDIGFFNIPFDGDDKGVSGNPSGFLVPAKGENVELAKSIVFFMISKEAMTEYFRVMPGIPFIKGIEVNLTGLQKDALDLVNAGMTSPSFSDYTIYTKGPLEKYMQDLLVGAKTPRQVCEELDNDFAKQAKAKGDPNWD
ncbi:MAG TPA: extracellular solute-binding protein [Clostridiaceae bacterium]|nr:extracellular solute-binding protein [Clostridiaceae bacterium]